jgi:hypothetical protein
MPPLTDLLARFAGSRRIGLNVSMLDPLSRWNPFHLLYERDSDVQTRPDLSLLAEVASVPLIGEILIEPYVPDYSALDLQDEARASIKRLLAARTAAVIPIDTRLPDNEGGLRSPEEIESVIERVDAVVTTRLHGLVLALKRGTPALAVDVMAGGGKITHQARELGWPYVVTADQITQGGLHAALDACFTDEARALARQTAANAAHRLGALHEQFVAAMSSPS